MATKGGGPGHQHFARTKIHEGIHAAHPLVDLDAHFASTKIGTVHPLTGRGVPPVRWCARHPGLHDRRRDAGRAGTGPVRLAGR